MPVNYSKPIEIRDARNGSWFWVHTHVLKDNKLHPYDKNIYALLASYTSQQQTAFPSIDRLAKESGISKRRVHQCIKQLEKYSYIKVDRIRGEHNTYTLCKTKPTSDIDVTSAGGAPVQVVHPTSARDDTTTSARSNTITISSITRSNNNILPKGNREETSHSENKSFGNQEINLILSTYKECFGFNPTDKYPRRVAQAFRLQINSFIKAYRPGTKFEDTLKKIFDWYMARDEIKGETLDIVRRKSSMLMDRAKAKGATV